jgi:hypothetical protein
VVSAAKGFVVKNPLTIIGGVVCLFAFGILAVVILSQGLSENARMIVIASIFSAVAAAIPGVLALYKSEATQHDIRNGVITSKVAEAIQHPDVQEAVKTTISNVIDDKQVVTRDGPSVTLAMEALAALLRQNTDTVAANTAVQKEGDSNG